MKIKEKKKRDKFFDLARELKKVELEVDSLSQLLLVRLKRTSKASIES